MKEETKKPAPVRGKAQFAAAAFGNLRSALGEDTRGEAIRIRLADIEEDPNQPRRTFSEEELASLADSIRERGVLQPIVVRPLGGGRYTLVMGARRLRASRIAGTPDIPAIIRRVEDDDYASQVIENQQRSNLSNSELATAVLRFAAEGKTSKQIGVICNLKEYQVAAFRKVDDFPPELRERMDAADMRALYDLYRQWTKTPAEVLAALPEPNTFITITEARRIIGGITGKATGSIVLDRAPLFGDEPKATPAPALLAVPEAGADEPEEAPNEADANSGKDGRGGEGRAPARRDRTEPRAQQPLAPVFIVRTKAGAEGRLVVNRRAGRDGWALVQIGAALEEIDLADLALARIE
ncbi:ParB/RepB/Spo0J family partition protein (plasmid) [Roseomonas sp. CCTCC AB2023176]|uniref:ParB/RepB/Spo0J family partition protein n=1 Tax=Roseomonas sp. CCTCC AB2023176 TaxID=3342640 RepID=UPI0035E020B8